MKVRIIRDEDGYHIQKKSFLFWRDWTRNKVFAGYQIIPSVYDTYDEALRQMCNRVFDNAKRKSRIKIYQEYHVEKDGTLSILEKK